MPRGKKQTAVVLLCKQCNQQVGSMQLNKKTKPENGFRKFCSKCRSRQEVKIKDAKSSKK